MPYYVVTVPELETKAPMFLITPDRGTTFIHELCVLSSREAAERLRDSWLVRPDRTVPVHTGVIREIEWKQIPAHWQPVIDADLPKFHVRNPVTGARAYFDGAPGVLYTWIPEYWGWAAV